MKKKSIHSTIKNKFFGWVNNVSCKSSILLASVTVLLLVSCGNGNNYDDALNKFVKHVEGFQKKVPNAIETAQITEGGGGAAEYSRQLYDIILKSMKNNIDSLATDLSILKEEGQDRDSYKQMLSIYGNVNEIYKLMESGQYNILVISEKNAAVSKEIELVKLDSTLK